MPTLGLLFVFRILDLSYMINTVIHTNPNSWYTFPSYFVFCATCKLMKGDVKEILKQNFKQKFKKKEIALKHK